MSFETTPSELFKSLIPQKKHLWIIPIDEEYPDIDNHCPLTPDELIKSQRFRFAKDQKSYIFFRSALRKILSVYCQEHPQKIEFEYNEFGKPFLKGKFKKLHFNFSHSGDLAVCALMNGSKIGADVERIETNLSFDSISEIFFSEREKTTLTNLFQECKALAFYSVWTGKEAYGKAVGCGITFPLHEVTIPVSYQPIKAPFIGLDGTPWEIESFTYERASMSYYISCVSDQQTIKTDVFLCKLNPKMSLSYELIRSY